MADFDVTVDTSIITVTWVSASESGLTGFTIKLETVLKHTGNSGYAADSHQITGLDAGKLYHLLITTNDGTTEREIPTDVTTSMYSFDISSTLLRKSLLYLHLPY